MNLTLTSQAFVLACAQCGMILTNPLVDLIDKSALSSKDGRDYIPRGYYVVSDGGYFTNTEGQFIVNLKSIVNTKRHPDPVRLNGCCGLDGCDGMNTVCENGHEVGTERSDCWLPHAIHFDGKAVTKLPAMRAVVQE